VERHYARTSPLTEALPAERKNLRDLPAAIGAYRKAAAARLSAEDREVLLPSDDTVAVYEGDGGARPSVSVIYWQPRKALLRENFRTPHYVDICYVGRGWSLAARYDEDARFPWLPEEELSSRLYAKGTVRRVVVFWRRSESLGELTRGFFQGGLRRRLRALVRSWKTPPRVALRGQYAVIISLDAGEDALAARDQALQFASALGRILPEFGVGRQSATGGLAGAP
jgi:hypothetical protein